MRNEIFENFLLKVKNLSVFFHCQVVRFLTETHLKVSIKELNNQIEKVIPSESDPIIQKKEMLLLFYKQLHSRISPRFAEGSLTPSLLNFLGLPLATSQHLSTSGELVKTSSSSSPTVAQKTKKESGSSEHITSSPDPMDTE